MTRGPALPAAGAPVTDARPDVAGRRLGTALAAALAFALFPGSAGYLDGMLPSLALRGVLAGLVAGLAARPGDGRAAPAWTAAAGAALGALPLLALLPPARAWGWAFAGLALAAFAALAAAWCRARLARWLAAAVALTVVVGAFAWTFGLVDGPYRPVLAERRLAAAQPVEPGRSMFDGGIYLRTYALMKGGAPYYAAFERAVREDARFTGRIPGPFGFREPALFELWRALPGADGAALLGWFIAASFVVALAGWCFAARFVDDGVALLAPIAFLAGQAFYVLSERTWFTFAEPWSAGLVIVAFTLLARGRWTASALVLVGAVAVRELAFLYLPAWVIAWSLAPRPRTRVPAFLVATLGAACPILLHVAMAPALPHGGGAGLATWLHSSGPARLTRALQHGLEVVPYGPALGPLLALAAAAGALALRERWARAALAAAVLVPAAFLLAISANPAHDYYWGAILVPVALALCPLAFARVLPPGPPARPGSAPGA